MKRGQVTIFIILTIVILAVALAVYLIKIKSSSQNKEYDDSEINQISQLINDCVEQGAIDAIYLIGLQGGYVNLPKEYIETELSDIAYGLKNGRNTLPLKEKIQDEIRYYLELTLGFCVYTITDSESQINEIPYSFMWGVENE